MRTHKQRRSWGVSLIRRFDKPKPPHLNQHSMFDLLTVDSQPVKSQLIFEAFKLVKTHHPLLVNTLADQVCQLSGNGDVN